MIKRLYLFFMIYGAASLSFFPQESYAQTKEHTPETYEEDLYTINFTNVSIIEFVKFVSKITKENFVFNEKELDFPVTIVSNEPTSSESVMSALLQILRINGFSLLEQDNNLVIHRNPEVKQIPTVVSDEVPLKKGMTPPAIMTRVFRVKNSDPSQLAGLIAPMLSPGALVEVAASSGHLIVSDVTGNIEQIEKLLQTLDVPSPELEVDAFSSKNAKVETLANLATKIVTPLAEGNPVILVPQISTSTIFIVSTPYLIERTISILEDLDGMPSTQRVLSPEDILIYRLQFKPESYVQKALDQIIEGLTQQGYASQGLVEAIKEMKYVPQTHSLLFTGDPKDLSKIQEFLKVIDISVADEGDIEQNFYVYKIKNAPESQISNAIERLIENLKETDYPDEGLIQGLESMRYIKETHSLVFTGTDQTLNKIKTILSEFDIHPGDTGKETLFVYRLKSVSKDKIERGLADIAAKLGANDPLRMIIESMKWLPDSHSFVFVGSPQAIQSLQEVLDKLDAPSTALKLSEKQKTYFLYKLKNVKGDLILEDFKKLAKNLENSGVDNQELIQSLKAAEWVKTTNSIYVSGTPEVLDQIKAVIMEYDVGRGPVGSTEQATNFFVYKPKYATPDEIKNSLLLIAEDLESAGLSDPTFLNTITTMKYVKATNSLIFTGTQKSIAQLQDLLASVDSPTEDLSRIQELGKTTFFIYRIKYVSAQMLMSSLKTMVEDFSKLGSPDTSLQKTIENMRYVKATNSIVFVGPSETLNRIKELLAKFDVAGLAEVPSERAAEGYILYKPKYQSGDELLQLLTDFEQNLVQSGVQEPNLFDAINNAKWMAKTSQILVSGTEPAIQKVQELLETFDIPSKDRITKEPTIETIDDMSFLIYKLQYHRGSEIEGALQKIAVDIKEEKVGQKNKNLLEAINSVQWIDITNSLIATGDAKTLGKLKELIQNIDVPLRQVFIEVLVIETSLSNALEFGLRWGSQGKYRSKFGYGFMNNPELSPDPFARFNTNLSNISATTTPKGSDIPLNVGGFDLGVIGDIIMHKGNSYFALGSLVNAIEVTGDTNIVLNQKIITQDGRLSTLFVGDNIPFTGSVIQITGAGSSLTSSVEYRDVGVSLSITPTLGETDIITLDIDEEITEAPNLPDNSQDITQLTGILTTKRNMQTRVHIPDRTFLVLSGQIRNQITRQRQGIPCLGGLPLVGAAFSQNQKNREATNVIIFVKPHIVDTWEEYKKVTQEQEDLYRDQVRPSGPDAVEDFDQGLELVQTPDDK